MSDRRLSKFQKGIILVLKRNGHASDYEDLRENVMDYLKIPWQREESFKASFSRSLKNLFEKHLVKRSCQGWRLGRTSLLWEDIALTKRGRYCKCL